MTIRGLVSRMFTILERYSIFVTKFAKAVVPMTKLCISYGVNPSYPSTATAIGRQPRLFQKLQNLGADLAIHGYRHLDYTLLDVPVVRAHYKEAVEVFNRNQIQFTGYRFPYLRRNKKRIDLLAEHDIEWDSSEVVAWPLIQKENMTDFQWAAYQKILTTYEPQWIDAQLSLPYLHGSLLEVPVSIPDDDILIERIKISKDEISKIWQTMVRQTAQLNEMVVLQLHPERYHWFDLPLQHVLKLLDDYPKVWKASLSQIAIWWKQKLASKIEIEPQKEKNWLIQTKLKDKVSLLVRNLHSSKMEAKRLNNGFFTQDAQLTIQSEKKPVIGIHSECDTWVQETVENDGFIFEISDKDNSFSLFIHKNEIANQRQLMDKIKQCTNPLIQIWRWPDEKEFCFCVSGDIDGTTLIDFWDRIYGRI